MGHKVLLIKLWPLKLEWTLPWLSSKHKDQLMMLSMRVPVFILSDFCSLGTQQQRRLVISSFHCKKKCFSQLLTCLSMSLAAEKAEGSPRPPEAIHCLMSNPQSDSDTWTLISAMLVQNRSRIPKVCIGTIHNSLISLLHADSQEWYRHPPV